MPKVCEKYRFDDIVSYIPWRNLRMEHPPVERRMLGMGGQVLSPVHIWPENLRRIDCRCKDK